MAAVSYVFPDVTRHFVDDFPSAYQNQPRMPAVLDLCNPNPEDLFHWWILLVLRAGLIHPQQNPTLYATL